MHAFQLTGVGKLSEVLADGLHGGFEPLRQLIDGNLPLFAGDIKDFGLTDILGHLLRNLWQNETKAKVCVDETKVNR